MKKKNPLAEPSVEQIGRTIFRVIHERRFRINHHSIGNVIDALCDPNDAPVKAWICRKLASSDRLTRSCFIAAFFKFIRQESVLECENYRTAAASSKTKASSQDSTKSTSSTRTSKQRPATTKKTR